MQVYLLTMTENELTIGKGVLSIDFTYLLARKSRVKRVDRENRYFMFNLRDCRIKIKS